VKRFKSFETFLSQAVTIFCQLWHMFKRKLMELRNSGGAQMSAAVRSFAYPAHQWFAQ